MSRRSSHLLAIPLYCFSLPINRSIHMDSDPYMFLHLNFCSFRNLRKTTTVSQSVSQSIKVIPPQITYLYFSFKRILIGVCFIYFISFIFLSVSFIFFLPLLFDRRLPRFMFYQHHSHTHTRCFTDILLTSRHIIILIPSLLLFLLPSLPPSRPISTREGRKRKG